MAAEPMEPLIRTALEADGVLVATLDMPGRTMNVFSAALMDALDTLMDRVDNDAAVRSVVLTSGKPSFLAGADLAMVRGYCDASSRMNAEQVFVMCGRLGRQMVRLEASAKPWVAAVNGLALGGGLELAMACRSRIVADDPKIQLGLPEVRLGLLPGAGGTQRLPRLIGFDLAMDLLLSGRPLAPQQALAAGLVEAVVPAAQLLDEAKILAQRLEGTSFDAATKFARHAQADVPPHTEEEARAVASTHGVTEADFEAYPAYSAIVDSVLLGARRTLAESTDIEMRQFLRLMFSPVAGNMVRTLFLDRQRADRELAAPADVHIEKIILGTISPQRAAWATALSKARLTSSPDATLGADTMELQDNSGARHRVALRLLADAAGSPEPEQAFVVLSPVGAFGSVLEIVGADDAAAAALAALGQRLRSLPYRTLTANSALLAQARVSCDDADAQAMTALSRAAKGPVGDLDFYDVACCVAGVTASWSGGPFTHLWREQARLVPRFDAEQAAAWHSGIEASLKQARS